MKTKLFTLLLLLSAAIASAETMRVAILEPVDRENKVSYATKLVLRSNLAKAITNATGYEAYDRSDIDAIVGEQNFQRTGMVSEDQIKRLGEMTGAKYILVAEAVMMDAKNMFITAKVLDVETARVVMSENQMMGVEAIKIQEGCITLASNLFHVSVPVAKETPVEKEVVETSVNVEETAIKLVKHTKQEMKFYGTSAYSYGNSEMDQKALEQFLKNTCPNAYYKYQSGKTLKKVGWGIFGSGFGMTVLGFSLMYGVGKINKEWINENAFFTGVGFICLGGVSIITVSIPLLCIGYHRTNHAYEVYNRHCAMQDKLSLNLQASNNGIGLALNF